MKTFLVSIMVGLGFSLPVTAQSYEETVQFVQEKTQVTFYDGEKLAAVSFPQRCLLQSTRTYIDDNGNRAESNRQALDLSEADPSKVESSIESSTIYVSTLRDVELVRYHQELYFPYAGKKNVYGETLGQHRSSYTCSGSTCVRQSTDSTIFFHTFNAEDNAPRLERAMRHLVRLCGGEEELF